MTIFCNLIQYSPSKNGFNTYIKNVLPIIKGARFIFQNGKLIIDSNDKPLPKELNLSGFCKLLHRYSFGQYAVNLKKLLLLSEYGLNDINCIYSPISDFIFQLKDVPQIITCHDLTPLYFSTSLRQRIRYEYLMINHFQSANKIIAISQFSANQLVSKGIKSSKITIIKNGVQVKNKRVDSKKSNDLIVIARHDLNKNLDYIIKVFIRIKSIKNDWDGRLIIVGRNGRKTKYLKYLCKEISLSEIVFMENIPEKHLISLIRNSMGLISSSFMEGFNYTILEAMAEGIPTLISDIEVHKELYSGNSLFFSLKDNGMELIKLIFEIQKNEMLWQDLSEKGYIFAKFMNTQKQQESIKSLLNDYKN